MRNHGCRTFDGRALASLGVSALMFLSGVASAGDPGDIGSTLAPPAPTLPMSVTGVYDSAQGTVILLEGNTLQEVSSIVSGAYDRRADWMSALESPEGTIQGTVVGQSVFFEWKKDGQYGKGVWVLDEGGRDLMGTWGNGEKTDGGGSWKLKRNDAKFEAFKMRSLQSEAMTNLSGLFTAETAFFGEYNTFSTDLMSVIWSPDGTPRYMYGFCSVFPASAVAGITGHDGKRNNTAHPGVIGKPARFSADHTKRLGDPCTILRHLGFEKDFAATGVSFKAFAIGNIDGDPDLDVWSIDNTRKLVNLKSD